MIRSIEKENQMLLPQMSFSFLFTIWLLSHISFFQRQLCLGWWVLQAWGKAEVEDNGSVVILIGNDLRENPLDENQYEEGFESQKTADDNLHGWAVSFEIDMEQKTVSFIRNFGQSETQETKTAKGF